MIAHDPLHRSGQAELPHPALASGRDVEAIAGPGVVDTDARNPSSDVSTDSIPRDPMRLAAPHERLPPEPDHLLPERTKTRTVAGHSVVTKVSADDAAQVRGLLGHGVVHAKPQLGLHLAQLCLPAFADRLPLQDMPT